MKHFNADRQNGSSETMKRKHKKITKYRKNKIEQIEKKKPKEIKPGLIVHLKM